MLKYIAIAGLTMSLVACEKKTTDVELKPVPVEVPAVPAISPEAAAENYAAAQALLSTDPEAAYDGMNKALAHMNVNQSILNSVGDVAVKLEKFSDAKGHFVQALGFVDPTVSATTEASFLYKIARTCASMKDYSCAIDYKARELVNEQAQGRQDRVTAIYGDLGYFYRDNGNAGLAAENFTRGINSATRNAIPAQVGYQSNALAFILKDQGDMGAACAAWKVARTGFATSNLGNLQEIVNGYLAENECS